MKLIPGPGNFPSFELTLNRDDLRTFAGRFGSCPAAFKLDKSGNVLVAAFFVSGASKIRRTHELIFHPPTRREQQKAETRRVNKRVRKILARLARTHGRNGAGK